ncbi:anti-sigma factor family protein, partial [Planctomycetota bacterium]
MSNYNPDDLRITAYVLGELDAEQQTQFETELAGSADLQTAIAEVRETVGMLETGFQAETRQTPGVHLARESAEVSHSLVSRRRWILGTVAAVLLVGLGLPIVSLLTRSGPTVFFQHDSTHAESRSTANIADESTVSNGENAFTEANAEVPVNATDSAYEVSKQDPDSDESNTGKRLLEQPILDAFGGPMKPDNPWLEKDPTATVVGDVAQAPAVTDGNDQISEADSTMMMVTPRIIISEEEEARGPDKVVSENKQPPERFVFDAHGSQPGATTFTFPHEDGTTTQLPQFADNSHEFDDLIEETIQSDTWDDVSGEGSIQEFPIKLSLVTSGSDVVYKPDSTSSVTEEDKLSSLESRLVRPSSRNGKSETFSLDPTGKPTSDLNLDFRRQAVDPSVSNIEIRETEFRRRRASDLLSEAEQKFVSQRLIPLQLEHEQLRRKYGNNHPEVVSIAKHLSRFEKLYPKLQDLNERSDGRGPGRGGDKFEPIHENDFFEVTNAPLSTFS